MSEVEAPRITPTLRDWALRALALRAGVAPAAGARTGFEELRLAVVYGEEEIPKHGRVLQIVAGNPEQWARLCAAAPGSLERVKVASEAAEGRADETTLPVLFGSAGSSSGELATLVDERVLRMNVDVVATTLFMLSRWEETIGSERDRFGRFPGRASTAHRQGFLHRPIVDDYALELRGRLRALVPAWKPASPRFEVQLEHDVDTLRRFTPERGLIAPRGGGRTVAAAILWGRLGSALSALREIRYSRHRSLRGEAFQGIRRLVALAGHHGFKSTFFFMAAKPSEHDVGYDLGGELAQMALAEIRGAGMKLAFHPGFTTFDDTQALRDEFHRFVRHTGETDVGVRQHYLRLRVPDTWRALIEVGVMWDASLGYADLPGFRAGTCHPFRPFDIDNDCELEIEERPLIVMDTSFTNPDYAPMAPGDALNTILDLASRCKRVGGTFRLLWHNTNAGRGWGRCYEEALSRLLRLRGEVS